MVWCFLSTQKPVVSSKASIWFLLIESPELIYFVFHSLMQTSCSVICMRSRYHITRPHPVLPHPDPHQHAHVSQPPRCLTERNDAPAFRALTQQAQFIAENNGRTTERKRKHPTCAFVCLSRICLIVRTFTEGVMPPWIGRLRWGYKSNGVGYSWCLRAATAIERSPWTLW